MIPVLPESAPFTLAQRNWLNGFLAGVLGLHRQARNGVGLDGASALAPASTNGFHTLAAGVSSNGAQVPVPPPPIDEPFPWHDPSLALEDRLKLAEGKPFARVLMSAMAQLDCGSCGYVCKTYAEAIASGEDADLTKCAPGGKPTAKKLKELVANRKPLSTVSQNGSNGHALNGVNGHALNGVNGKSLSGANGHAHNGTNGKHHGAVVEAASRSRPQAAVEFDRKNPYPATLRFCNALTRPGSEKDVRHVAFNLKGSGLRYEVGDALGLYPENSPEMVETVLAALGARGDELVQAPDGKTVYSYEALVKDFAITKLSEPFITLLARYAADSSEASTLQALVENDPDGILEMWDVLDLLEQFPSARPPVPEMIAALSPLQPRLYSISSSLKAHPDEVHLTVGVVRYSRSGRVRKGVASTFMTEILRPRQKARVFVHSSHGFRLPLDNDAPIIMIGPGTGIAPFRAFLQEREALGARGKNWLFFGDQRRNFDFLFEEEMVSYRQRGLLSRLDTAFSRDQEQKVYVQHLMKENAAEIWAWLQEGAHVYVCGDARRMALDVDHALHGIVSEQGKMPADAANEFVKNLTKSSRYQRDVY